MDNVTFVHWDQYRIYAELYLYFSVNVYDQCLIERLRQL